MPNRYNFNIDYAVAGKAGKITVAAEDLETAARAANVKLAMKHRGADIEIRGGERKGGPLQKTPAAAFLDSVRGEGPFDALRLIAQDLNGAPPYSTDDGEWARKAEFIAVLLDAGLPVSSDLLDAYDHAASDWIPSYFNFDPTEPGRAPVSPEEALFGVANALHGSWRSGRFESRYDDEQTDYAGNLLAKSFLTAVSALEGVEGEYAATDWMLGTHRKIVRLYAEANSDHEMAL